MPIALTLYIYPAPKFTSFGSPKTVIGEVKENLFHNEFEQNIQIINNSHNITKTVIHKHCFIEQNNIKHKGLHAEFLYSEIFGGSFQPLIFELYLFQSGNFLYKYRITYPKDIDAKKEIKNFMTRLKLKNNNI